MMSLIRTVPVKVPSLFHSSKPESGCAAAKMRLPLSAAKWAGALLAAPGWMSLTSTVPPTVPSVFHSSIPWTPSSAAKKVVGPARVKPYGLEGSVAGLISRTM